MKVFVICNSDSLAIPSIVKLSELGVLVGLAIVKKAKKLLLPRLEALDLGLTPMVLERSTWEVELAEAIKDNGTDAVWALTFPWKVPASLLNIPPQGFINFHFGLLPKYAGADPIFWQFKNRESDGGLTVHLMSDEIDKGPILFQEKMKMMPGENYGFHCLRLGTFAVEQLDKIIDKVGQAPRDFLKLEDPDYVIEHKPTENDLGIDWAHQTAEEIEWLVNATNPVYGGARTRMNDNEIRILEVTPVNLDGEIKAEPGQIVHADVTFGVVVACSDNECIRITVVHTAEGYLSGVKLFNLGFTPGHIFG